MAYHHPSEPMAEFAKKHFGLTGSKVVSTFTVFSQFFEKSSPGAQSVQPTTKSSEPAAKVELDEPVIEEVEELDSDPLKPYRVDENEFYTQRTKLYCYNVDEWQDAGAGQVTFLKHTTTGRVRLMFVQELGKRVLANHFIVNQPGFCELQRHTAGNDKTWTWTAQERVLERRFALKFKSTEDATQFKEVFDGVKRLFVESAAVEYVVVRKVGVTADSNVPSKHVKLLPVGSIVNVVEVAYLSEEKRVRARLVQPEGWITLLSHNTADTGSYAIARKDLDSYSAKAVPSS